MKYEVTVKCYKISQEGEDGMELQVESNIGLKILPLSFTRATVYLIHIVFMRRQKSFTQ